MSTENHSIKMLPEYKLLEEQFPEEEFPVHADFPFQTIFGNPKIVIYLTFSKPHVKFALCKFQKPCVCLYLELHHE